MAEAAGWLAAVAVATPFALGLAAGEAPDRGEALFTFADPEITESSGLAVVAGGPAGRLVATVNDSGDTGRVFAVDPATGETVGVTTFADSPRDVEAVAPDGAPGSGDAVWVGDIGDNLRARDSIEVVRVPVGAGDRSEPGQAYELVYPDGARDAEALLVQPRTGRLLVVSKVVFGGTVYAAPATLDATSPNELTALGQVAGIVTDGAFLPDGRHLVVRTYTSAYLHAFPSLELLGELELPRQAQGEGLAVTPEGDLLLGTEGQFTEVLRVALPESWREAVAAPEVSDEEGAPDEEAPDGVPDRPAGEQDAVEVGWWPWLTGGAVMLVMVAVLLRSLRPPD